MYDMHVLPSVQLFWFLFVTTTSITTTMITTMKNGKDAGAGQNASGVLLYDPPTIELHMSNVCQRYVAGSGSERHSRAPRLDG